MKQLMFTFKGHTAPNTVLDGVRSGDIGAFCLFDGINVETPAQLRELSETLRKAATDGGLPPPLIGIDQEGGQLIAVTGGTTELPGNMALGATRSLELAEQAGYVLARELLAMGCNLDFAPVLDVNVNPDNPGVGLRSFGDDPQLVAELGSALIRGMQREGVIATAKHFPGSGDLSTDTHFAAALVPHSMERLESLELVPFRAAIAEQVGAIMTAHVMFEALDRENPATVSPTVLDGFLRGQMGYQGLIITDAMDMAAVSVRGRFECVEQAIRAGADLILLGHLPDQFGILEHIKTLNLARTAAEARILAARHSTPAALPDFSVVGCAEHRAIAQRIAERSITQVRNTKQIPLRPHENETIAVITAQPVNLTPADTSAEVKIQFAEAIRRRHPRTKGYELRHGAGNADIAAILEAVKDADHVIVGTSTVERDPAQGELVRALHHAGKAPVVVALRTPYDLRAFPEINTYLCAYSIRDASVEAATRVLFGEIEARGVLPCALPV